MTLVQKFEKFMDKYNIPGRLFYIAWVFFTLSFMLNLTAWDGLDHSGQTEHILRLIRYASCCIFIIVIALKLLMKGYEKKHLIMYAVLCAAILLVVYFSHDKLMGYYFTAFMAAYREDARKVACVSAVLTGGLLLVNLIGSYTGFSVNYLFGEAERARFGLGFSWTSSAPVLFLFFTMLYIYIRKEKMHFWEFIILEAFNVYFYIMTDSRFAFVLGSAVVVFFFIESLFKDHFRFVMRIKWLMTVLPFIIALLVILSYFIYDPDLSFFRELNSLLSDRYELGSSGIERYGISLFGQPIQWFGYDINNLVIADYNYVDCSYLQILLQYGITMLLAALYIYARGIYRAAKVQDGYFMCILVFISVFSITEPRLMNLAFNVFPVLCFCSLKEKSV